MANPAELLHRLLSSWAGSPRTSTTTVRQDRELKEHFRAVGYLNSIDEALIALEEQGKKVKVWRKHFPEWKRMVFNYPRGWEAANKGAIDPVALDHLETLIDRVDDLTPQINVDKVAVLELYLSAVEIALKDDDSLPNATRMQVVAAISHIRSYVDDLENADSFDFQKAISQLFAVLAHVVFVSKKRDRWDGWWENFCWMGAGDFYGRTADSVGELVESHGGMLALIAGG